MFAEIKGQQTAAPSGRHIVNPKTSSTMANTYSQLYTHIVFAVKGRANLISPTWRTNLFKYITGIVTNKDQKMMVINGVADHVHILVSIKPDCVLSDLVRDIKANSSKWINENHFVVGKFEWQAGFGSFSVSASQVKNVIRYIERQEEHHQKQTLKDEYVQFLKDYEIGFLPKYIFDDFGSAPTGL
jgi:putative transposase